MHGFLACLSVQLDGKCFPPFLRREHTLLPEDRLSSFHPGHIGTDLLLVQSELGSVYRDTLQVRLFPEVGNRSPELSKRSVRLWDQVAVRQLAPFRREEDTEMITKQWQLRPIELVRSRTNLDPMLMVRVGRQDLRQRMQNEPSDEGSDPLYVVTDGCGFMFLLPRRFHSRPHIFQGVTFFFSRDNVAFALALVVSARQARAGGARRAGRRAGR